MKQARRRQRRRAEAKALELGVVPGQVSAGESADGRGSARRGERYEAWVAEGWPLRIAAGDLTVKDIVLATGSAQATVSQWYAAWRQDELSERRRAGWLPSPEVQAMLRLEPAAFPLFRAAFFRDERGRPYLTPVAHVRWIAALLVALTTGGRLLILSPPRHGKSQLLVHLVVWLVCINPNIRIIWVGGNEDIAKMMVGAVLDELENNRALRDAVLGPAGSFKPEGRAGKSWSPSQITVGTRTATGIKSPTLVALGKGGKILSRDADLVVFDDIVDHDSVQSPSQRGRDHSWLNTQLASRKEEHTAMAGIGSRQHHDDLWGRLAANPAWGAIVEHAHDPDCDLPTHGPLPADEHQECAVCAAHVDCLLFPELRSMRWLEDQRAAMADDLQFEMVYQNVTHSDGAEFLTVEHLRSCRNKSRRLGEVPAGTTLIGGLDPATSGFQASVLWGFDPVSKKRLLVDLDNRRAGGVPGARDIIRSWFEVHGLRMWVIESIGYQQALLLDREIVEFCSRHGITLFPHVTNRFNKWSKDFGVTAQFALFRHDPPLIDLPYGDARSIDRVRVYEQQLLNFEPAETGHKQRRPSDLVMAGWFPETQIRLWLAEMSADIVDDHDMAGYTSLRFGDGYASTLGELVGS